MANFSQTLSGHLLFKKEQGYGGNMLLQKKHRGLSIMGIFFFKSWDLYSGNLKKKTLHQSIIVRTHFSIEHIFYSWNPFPSPAPGHPVATL